MHRYKISIVISMRMEQTFLASITHTKVSVVKLEAKPDTTKINILLTQYTRGQVVTSFQFGVTGNKWFSTT